jgi:hypothetical protein
MCAREESFGLGADDTPVRNAAKTAGDSATPGRHG